MHFNCFGKTNMRFRGKMDLPIACWEWDHRILILWKYKNPGNDGDPSAQIPLVQVDSNIGMAVLATMLPLIPEIHQRIDQENQANAIEQKKSVRGHWIFSHLQLGIV